MSQKVLACQGYRICIRGSSKSPLRCFCSAKLTAIFARLAPGLAIKCFLEPCLVTEASFVQATVCVRPLTLLTQAAWAIHEPLTLVLHKFCDNSWTVVMKCHTEDTVCLSFYIPCDSLQLENREKLRYIHPCCAQNLVQQRCAGIYPPDEQVLAPGLQTARSVCCSHVNASLICMLPCAADTTSACLMRPAGVAGQGSNPFQAGWGSLTLLHTQTSLCQNP